MTDTAVTKASSDLVARADLQYRWRVYLFFLFIFGYGLWSARDGFVVWPEQNAQWKAMQDRGALPPQKLHTPFDIFLNRALGVAFPAVSLPLFLWLMYRSRGAYRLSKDTLQLPGHSPIPLEKIEALDKTRWDRKGIASIEYVDSSGAKRSASLRDMVYHRQTTDEIVDRIEAHLERDEPHSAAAPSNE